MNEPRFRFSGIRAEHIGKLVSAKVYIAGESGTKTLDVRFKATCSKCKNEDFVDLSTNPKTLYSLIHHQDIDILPANSDRKCEKGGKHHWVSEPIDPSLLFEEVYLRDVVESNDDGPSANHAYRGFVIGKVPEDKEAATLGILLGNPRTDDVEFLISNVVPNADSLDTFSLAPEDALALREYFHGRTLSDFKELAKSVNPRIARRISAKMAALLAYVSPTWLNLNGQRRAGTLRVMFFGDPRTGKGSTADYLRQELKLGKHAIGETSSRTGITYSIDSERGIIVWGVLVEADRGLLVIEAMHKLPAEDLATMRETLVKLYVEVRRSFSAKAHARTRVIGDSNARMDMGLYPFRCLAVASLPCFKDQVDVTRWDLFISFMAGEVPPDEMSTASLDGRDDVEFLKLLKLLVLWVWSRRPEQIIFDEDALKNARENYKALLTDYAISSIPVVHEDSLYSILRMAAAFAALEFSTLEFETLIVKEHHVQLAVEFLRETLEDLEVPLYRAHHGASNQLTERDFEEFVTTLGASDVAKTAIEALVVGPANSRDLEAKIGHDEASIRRTMSELKAGSWIEKKSVGYVLTAKAVQAWRRSRDATNATNATAKEPPDGNRQLKIEVKEGGYDSGVASVASVTSDDRKEAGK